MSWVIQSRLQRRAPMRMFRFAPTSRCLPGQTRLTQVLVEQALLLRQGLEDRSRFSPRIVLPDAGSKAIQYKSRIACARHSSQCFSFAIPENRQRNGSGAANPSEEFLLHRTSLIPLGAAKSDYTRSTHCDGTLSARQARKPFIAFRYFKVALTGRFWKEIGQLGRES